MQYKIIRNYDNRTLCRAIEEYLARGWHLAGGVSVTERPGGLYFHQAITLVGTEKIPTKDA